MNEKGIKRGMKNILRSIFRSTENTQKFHENQSSRFEDLLLHKVRHEQA